LGKSSFSRHSSRTAERRSLPGAILIASPCPGLPGASPPGAANSLLGRLPTRTEPEAGGGGPPASGGRATRLRPGRPAGDRGAGAKAGGCQVRRPTMIWRSVALALLLAPLFVASASSRPTVASAFRRRRPSTRFLSGSIAVACELRAGSASRHTIQAIASSGVRRMRTNSCRHQSPQRAGTKPSGPPGRPVLQGHDGIAAAALPAVTI